MLQTFRSILDQIGHFPADTPLVAAVSGGPDSLTLLDLLVRAGYQPLVAHFNHHIRPDADMDAVFVEQAARTRGCAFISGEALIVDQARDQKVSIETAARQARYTFLFEVARRHQAAAVLVGHTADDQVETVLQHILRGSGLDGLQGMQAVTFLPDFSGHIPLVRPLLSFWRTEIEAYCQEQNLQPRTDSTNVDPHYNRNRIRAELIPYLESFNPQVKQRLYSLAQIVNSAQQIIDPQVAAAETALVLERHADFWVLDRPDACRENAGVLDLVIRRCAYALRPHAEDFRWELFIRARSAVQAGARSGRYELGDGVGVYISQDRIYIALETAQIVENSWPAAVHPEPTAFTMPGKIDLRNGFTIEVGAPQDYFPGVMLIPQDAHTVWVDADRIDGAALCVRCANAGDRFQPLGRSETQKLSDFFTNRKLPRPARSLWPLLVSANRIVWVVGMALDDAVKVTEHTRQIVQFRLTR